MYISALEALAATMLTSAENVLKGAAKVLAMPRLTDASRWHLIKPDVPVRPSVFQERDPIEFTALEGKTGEGFPPEKRLCGVRPRYAITYDDWQHVSYENSGARNRTGDLGIMKPTL